MTRFRPGRLLRMLSRSRDAWATVGVVALFLLAWLGGDLLQVEPVDLVSPDRTPLLVASAAALAWLVFRLGGVWLARRRNASLVRALRRLGPTSAPSERPSGPDPDTDLDRLLDRLRRRPLVGSSGTHWLRDLPWYVMIGPPAAGKTTLLLQAGLDFPLGSTGGALSGIAGTRACDWLVSDRAVMIDTGGRYTSEDSAEEIDAEGWRRFLKVLRRHRHPCPVDGVLIVLPVPELIAGRSADGIEHARAMASRLVELERELGVRLPAYLLLTKADLVAGFGEFFANLAEAERGQVWGTTLPGGPAGGALDHVALKMGLAELVARLDSLVRERLIAERDVDRRALILGFPCQVQLVVGDALRLVRAVADAWEPPASPWIRGVYLASAAQSGPPFDRLAVSFAQGLGLPLEPQPTISGERGFFLERLVREVVLGEAGLVGRDARKERLGRWARATGAALLAFGIAAIIGAWTWSYLGNRDRELSLEQTLSAWSETYATLAVQPQLRSPDGLAAIVPALDQLAALAAAARAPDPPALKLGLSRRAALAAQTEAAYAAALRGLFLRRLLTRVEHRLRTAEADPTELAQSLRVYLMLGGRERPDATLLAAWLDHDIGSEPPSLAAALAPHLTALVGALPAFDEPPALDEALIARVRAELAAPPPTSRSEVPPVTGVTAATTEPAPPLPAPRRSHRP